jgi:hypothetical protein
MHIRRLVLGLQFFYHALLAIIADIARSGLHAT